MFEVKPLAVNNRTVLRCSESFQMSKGFALPEDRFHSQTSIDHVRKVKSPWTTIALSHRLLRILGALLDSVNSTSLCVA